jgi:hypothetical protein
MIVISAFFAFVSGVAANQLDRPIALIRDTGWELVARYITGILAAFSPFVLLLWYLNPKALKDGTLAFLGAFTCVGLGVVSARIVKDLTEGRA